VIKLVGAFSHLSAGEIFSPVQPKPLNTCLLVNVPPFLIVALVTVKSAADTLAEINVNNIRIIFFIKNLSSAILLQIGINAINSIRRFLPPMDINQIANTQVLSYLLSVSIGVHP
jgi:hypothetical protein